MRRFAATLSVVLAGCATDSTGPGIPWLPGTYSYWVDIGNVAAGFSCNSSGTLALEQQGSRFSGETNGATVCDGPGGPIYDERVTQLTDGEISGQSVSFRFQVFEASCNAAGVASGAPVNNLAGATACILVVSGQQLALDGHWGASR
jgi:hypothetical protein